MLILANMILNQLKIVPEVESSDTFFNIILQLFSPAGIDFFLKSCNQCNVASMHFKILQTHVRCVFQTGAKGVDDILLVFIYILYPVHKLLLWN